MTVALHRRKEKSATPEEARIEKLASLCASHGVGPKRLAFGGDWFIEEWAGSTIGFNDRELSASELAKLCASFHLLPT